MVKQFIFRLIFSKISKIFKILINIFEFIIELKSIIRKINNNQSIINQFLDSLNKRFKEKY